MLLVVFDCISFSAYLPLDGLHRSVPGLSIANVCCFFRCDLHQSFVHWSSISSSGYVCNCFVGRKLCLLIASSSTVGGVGWVVGVWMAPAIIGAQRFSQNASSSLFIFWESSLETCSRNSLSFFWYRRSERQQVRIPLDPQFASSSKRG